MKRVNGIWSVNINGTMIEAGDLQEAFAIFRVFNPGRI